MDGCWIRPLFPIALATDVVEVRLDLREAFEFPIDLLVLAEVVRTLRNAGYAFVRLGEAAEQMFPT